jgi:hypothetical protein
MGSEAAGIWEVKRRVYGKWSSGYMGSEAVGIWEMTEAAGGKRQSDSDGYLRIWEVSESAGYMRSDWSSWCMGNAKSDMAYGK